MNLERIVAVLESPTEKAIEELLADEETVFWVDWREEDEAIVEYCESILRTGELTTESVHSGTSYEWFLHFRDRRVQVPLTMSTKDRHITLVALNQVLTPEFEVRFCLDSNGGDTLAFVPLASNEWTELERKYGEVVGKRFHRLAEKPNVFTDAIPK